MPMASSRSRCRTRRVTTPVGIACGAAHPGTPWQWGEQTFGCDGSGDRIGRRCAPMEPFRWRRAFFLGLVSYAASLAGLVFDTFVPVLLQAGHPLWHNTTGL